MIRFSLLFLFLSVLFLNPVHHSLTPMSQPSTTRPNAAPVPVGAGSYSTTVPAGQDAPQSTIYRTPDLASRPMPTNQWWSALAWQLSGNRALFAHPLALAPLPDGLAFSYPNVPFVSTLGEEYRYRFFEDFRVGTAALSTGSATPLVAGYTDWSVTAAWDGDALRATMGHGFPFVYFTAADASEIVLTFRKAPEVTPNDDGSAQVRINNRVYGVFAPAGAVWSLDAAANQLRATLPAGQAYFSVAVLPDDSPATFADYRAHAFAFITGTRVEWSYDEATAAMTTTYHLQTQVMEGDETRPLIALYRHQWINTPEATLNTPYTYTSARGEMRVIRADQFQTVMTYPGVLPHLPALETVNVAQDETITTDLNRVDRFAPDLRLNLPGPGGERDTYWTGKGLNRVAMLVPIAAQAGDTALRDSLLSTLRDRLQDWFTVAPGEALPHFTYDATWGTLIGYPAAGFGYQTYLNDHHFHHGYFIRAAAEIALHDPAWAAADQWGGMVDLLIRDANSPDANDPLFPRLRSFDVYAGHSWASGANGGDHGANQESSSEAMNFAAAVILWGEATGDRALRDFGIYLYTTEMHAIQQYWLDVDQAVFPEGFAHPALGILWSDGGHYTTWWTTDPEAIHAINFLPITPASLYLGQTPAYLGDNYAHLVAESGGVDSFTDVILATYALSDPAAALAAWEAGTVEPEWGETRAHIRHWLLTLNTLGIVDPTVTADTALYAVFTRDGERSYVAYNAGSTPRTVTFSDGTTLTVQPGQTGIQTAAE